jgi:chorismate synthase
MLLKNNGINVSAFVKQIGSVKLDIDHSSLDLTATESNEVRCPDAGKAAEMRELIAATMKAGDSLGGVIQCVITGAPAGLGEPVFDKLHAVLGHAMLSINAVKGFEIGSGFGAASLKGSEHNDEFVNEGGIRTRTNNSGGIQGGISNGMPVYFNVAFKPVATIMKSQSTVDKDGNSVTLEGKGRHDACVLPRAVPIVEAMAALVMADFLLLSRLSRV